MAQSLQSDEFLDTEFEDGNYNQVAQTGFVLKTKPDPHKSNVSEVPVSVASDLRMVSSENKTSGFTNSTNQNWLDSPKSANAWEKLESDNGEEW